MTSIWFPNIKYPPNTKNYLPCFVLGGGVQYQEEGIMHCALFPEARCKHIGPCKCVSTFGTPYNTYSTLFNQHLEKQRFHYSNQRFHWLLDVIVPPNHPKLDHSSIEASGDLGVPQYWETPSFLAKPRSIRPGDPDEEALMRSKDLQGGRCGKIKPT